MRIAGLTQDSTVDGPGLRFTTFVQGCKLHCKGCHNPGTWDMDGGIEMSTGEVIAEMRRNPLTDGLTLSGGEPFLQAGGCAEIAKAAREDGLNVWAYTGFKFEDLLALAETDADVMALLELIDVLVDGRFNIKKRTFERLWRGSRNQRLIDVQESLKAGTAVALPQN